MTTRTRAMNGNLDIPNYLKHLGTMPDAALAKQLRRTVLAVVVRRRDLGIEKFGGSMRRWTRKEEALLGMVLDKKLVRQLNRSYGAIALRRQTSRMR